MLRTLTIALLAAVLPPIAAGQMSNGNFAAWGRGPLAIPSGQVFPHAGAPLGPRQFTHSRSSGFGYPLFYADYGSAPAVPPAPQVVIVEERAPQPEAKPEPIMIEWQGDRFVRYGGAETGARSPDYSEAVSGGRKRSEVSREVPPAVLVYRDGHREEVRDYVITRGVLYARGDGYSLPSRNIQLSALDLSATFQVNQDSGVRFVLPERTNDVVTKP
jgi:hypothetical protein